MECTGDTAEVEAWEIEEVIVDVDIVAHTIARGRPACRSVRHPEDTV